MCFISYTGIINIKLQFESRKLALPGGPWPRSAPAGPHIRVCTCADNVDEIKADLESTAGLHAF